MTDNEIYKLLLLLLQGRRCVFVEVMGLRYQSCLGRNQSEYTAEENGHREYQFALDDVTAITIRDGMLPEIHIAAGFFRLCGDE